MVKQQKNDSTKSPISKGSEDQSVRAIKINASTHYETCKEQLSPFGGLLDLVNFQEILKKPMSSRAVNPSWAITQ